jgi:hypothetical protein
MTSDNSERSFPNLAGDPTDSQQIKMTKSAIVHHEQRGGGPPQGAGHALSRSPPCRATEPRCEAGLGPSGDDRCRVEATGNQPTARVAAIPACARASHGARGGQGNPAKLGGQAAGRPCPPLRSVQLNGAGRDRRTAPGRTKERTSGDGARAAFRLRHSARIRMCLLPFFRAIIDQTAMLRPRRSI